MEDAKSATELIADDLATYPDNRLVETFLTGLQEFLDSPARVSTFNRMKCRTPVLILMIMGPGLELCTRAGRRAGADHIRRPLITCQAPVIIFCCAGAAGFESSLCGLLPFSVSLLLNYGT